jgi:uncharacterized protein (UPF0332 family)
LLHAGNGAPTQSNLKRAQSTIYYAVFHCLAHDAADMLIGSKGADRSQKAWIQVYRSLQHNKAWERCAKVKTLTFPDTIKDFAYAFRSLQHKREAADYDPECKLSKQQVVIDIEYARQVIADYKAENKKHRRAFGAFMLLEKRPEKAP